MWQQLKMAVRRSRDWSRRRRDYAWLASMDDVMLRDIGVHRGDVHARVLGRHLAI